MPSYWFAHIGLMPVGQMSACLTDWWTGRTVFFNIFEYGQILLQTVQEQLLISSVSKVNQTSSPHVWFLRLTAQVYANSFISVNPFCFCSECNGKSFHHQKCLFSFQTQLVVFIQTGLRFVLASRKMCLIMLPFKFWNIVMWSVLSSGPFCSL